MKLACGVALVVVLAAASAHAKAEEGRTRPVACADLTTFTSEGSTTVTYPFD